MEIVKKAIIKQGSAWRGGPTVIGGPDGLLARLVPFDSQGAMKARRYDGTIAPEYLGRSGRSFSDFMTRQYDSIDGPGYRQYGPLYVVYSYLTPIAWVNHRGECVIPDENYSVTTTHHQNKCRAWMGTARHYSHYDGRSITAAERAARLASTHRWVTNKDM